MGLASLPPDEAQQDMALVVGVALGLGVNSTHMDALHVASSARMMGAMKEAGPKARRRPRMSHACACGTKSTCTSTHHAQGWWRHVIHAAAAGEATETCIAGPHPAPQRR